MDPPSARFAAVAAEITRLTGRECAPQPERQVSGGSISACYRWRWGRGTAFIKLAGADDRGAFEAEAAGLAALADTGTLRVPRLLASGATADLAFLALEWIEAGARSAASERRLGAALAALHTVCATRFGWQRDNTIGRTPQRNDWMDEWDQFFRERRLRPQLERAVAGGHGELLGRPGAELLEALPRLLAGHRPAASLLHGDLWGGNWLSDADGQPVVFDVAVYYGDAETDLAMTRLFGGFGPEFYRAYEVARPAAAGAARRIALYNLYHVLNHANLFGGGYARQARATIDSLLAQQR